MFYDVSFVGNYLIERLKSVLEKVFFGKVEFCYFFFILEDGMCCLELLEICC